MAGEHFHLLSAGLAGISNTRTHTHARSHLHLFMDLYGHLRNQQLLFICVKISAFSPHYIYLMDLTNHSRMAGSDLLLMTLRWKHQILLANSADPDLPYSSRFINTNFSVLPLSWQLRTGQLKHVLWQFSVLLLLFQMSETDPFCSLWTTWIKILFLGILRTIYFINKPAIVYHTSCTSLEATIEILRLLNRPWCVKPGMSHSWSL